MCRVIEEKGAFVVVGEWGRGGSTNVLTIGPVFAQIEYERKKESFDVIHFPIIVKRRKQGGRAEKQTVQQQKVEC